jgi:chorismate mutase
MISTDLAKIAAHLEGLEETIIHRLIDRAQFAENPGAYAAGQSGFTGAGAESLFDLRLLYQERMDAEFGRSSVPEEQPFHDDLPGPRRRIVLPESPLDPRASAAVNRTRALAGHYLRYVNTLCAAGDDAQYGSSVEHDVLAIQAIARRVHYGALYVAESKYRDNPGEMASAAGLAELGDTGPLYRLITREEVEQRVLRRVAEKVDYIQASLNPGVRRRVEPELVLGFYRDTIIPETKAGEVDYLVARQLSQRSSSIT